VLASILLFGFSRDIEKCLGERSQSSRLHLLPIPKRGIERYQRRIVAGTAEGVFERPFHGFPDT
jgi:hypothetical protein